MNAKAKFKDIFSLLKETAKEWSNDDPFRHSAVIAYYSIFSLPALVIIIVQVAGLILGEDAAQGQISSQISSAIGEDAAKQVETMVSNTSEMGNSTFAIIIGIATLLFGATGVFYQLQQSLNKVWEVEPNPDAGIAKIAIDRATSLGVILAIGFLLLIFMIITAALNILSGWIQSQLPDFMFYVFQVLNFLVTLGIVTLLFALIYKVLPDAKVGWQSVWVGAFVTALLFTIGRFALAFYFTKADPASAFGVAGSLILILLWVNYSALILLFGAEFTQVFARRYGHQIEPSDHARRSPGFRLKHRRQQEHDDVRQQEKTEADHKY